MCIPGVDFEVNESYQSIDNSLKNPQETVDLFLDNQTLDVYSTKIEYIAIYSFLMNLELQVDESRNSMSELNNVRIFKRSQYLAQFHGDELNCKFKIYDKLAIKHEHGVSKGELIKTERNGLFSIKLYDYLPDVKEVSLKVENKKNPLQKIIDGLESFEKSRIDADIVNIILGQSSVILLNFYNFDLDFSIPGLLDLNPSQNTAVSHALKYKFSIIQGPPGTGKTETLAAIVFHILYNTEKVFDCDKKILVCANSNVATTLLKERLVSKGIEAIQVYTKSQHIHHATDKNSLHYQVDIFLSSNPNYLRLIEEKEKIERKLSDLNQKTTSLLQTQKKHIEKRILELSANAEDEILNKFPVICCTCVTSAHDRFKKYDFNHLIIDEASQVTDPESILCLLRKPKHVILIGDTNQLGCFVRSKNCEVSGLAKSIMERLIITGVPSYMLNIQYRMHPLIAKFPNERFYDTSIIDGVTEEERTFVDFSFPDPIGKKPTFFFDIKSSEEVGGNGITVINRYERDLIKDLLSFFYETRISYKQIGIICFYDGQRGYLLNYLEWFFDPERYENSDTFEENYEKMNRKSKKNDEKSKKDDDFIQNVEIMSVDSSQGREFDFIILSCARANNHLGIGYLNEKRRLNVALTRAKYGLIIIGNYDTLIQSDLWYDLIDYYHQYNLVFTGDFYNIRHKK